MTKLSSSQCAYGYRYRQRDNWSCWYFTLDKDLPVDAVISSCRLYGLDGKLHRARAVFFQSKLNEVQYGSPTVVGGTIGVYPLDYANAECVGNIGSDTDLTKTFAEFVTLHGGIPAQSMVGLWIKIPEMESALSLIIDWTVLIEPSIHVDQSTNGHVDALNRLENHG